MNKRCLFKKIRLQNAKRIFNELVNELVCKELASKIKVPTADVFVGFHPSYGPGAYSVLTGENDLRQLESFRARITNSDKLKELFVFDQWIFNEDRRLDHVKLGVDPVESDRFYLYGIDHGHTLNGYDGTKWTEVTFTQVEAKIIAPVSFDPGISKFSETSTIREIVKSVKDQTISRIVNESVDQVCELNLSQDEMTETERKAVVIKRILRMRRDQIDIIVKQWCSQTGKHVD